MRGRIGAVVLTGSAFVFGVEVGWRWCRREAVSKAAPLLTKAFADGMAAGQASERIRRGLIDLAREGKVNERQAEGPERASNSILAETDLGTYYTGPLEPAIKAMRDEYGDAITVSQNSVTGAWFAVEHRGSPDDSIYNQWGQGSTEEEAWRYLIGADFGPIDATYIEEGYEAHQRQMLGLNPA